MTQAKIILVAGPTASGKSAKAMELARQRRGTIINADAMQIYAGLPILTAQPSPEEQNEIPHMLYGTLDPVEGSSAGKWLGLAQQAIAEVVAAGRTPILAGGTGLYFRALLGGLADMPDIPDEVREATEKLYGEIGEEKFRAELWQLDQESALRLAPNDRQRSIRAYEVAKHTGKPIGEWQKRETTPPVYEIESYLLMPPREELYAACDKRFEKMIEQGAVEEAKALLDRNLDPALPSMKTIGLRKIGLYLKNETTLEEAIAKSQQMTRNYAKRQMTWFRNQWEF